jgi:hypothetical protein
MAAGRGVAGAKGCNARTSAGSNRTGRRIEGGTGHAIKGGSGTSNTAARGLCVSQKKHARGGAHGGAGVGQAATARPLM